MLQPRSTGDNLPEATKLMGDESVLAERVERWAEEHQRKGRVQGETELLRRLLERRFGAVSEGVDPKLANATEADLIRWSEEIFDAQTLDKLFAH